MGGRTAGTCEACDADLERVAFRCEECGDHYCRDHRAAGGHACSADETNYATVDPTRADGSFHADGDHGLPEPGDGSGSRWITRLSALVAGAGLLLFAIPPLAFGLLRLQPELLRIGFGNAVLMVIVGAVLKVVGDHVLGRF